MPLVEDLRYPALDFVTNLQTKFGSNTFSSFHDMIIFTSILRVQKLDLNGF